MQHAVDCQCEHCKPQVKKGKSTVPIKQYSDDNPPIENFENAQQNKVQIDEVHPPVYLPPKNAKTIAELNEKVEYYAKLQNDFMQQHRQMHRPIKRQMPLMRQAGFDKPWYKGIGIWFALILVFVMIYGIYLFLMAQQGKHIVLPFK